MLKKVILKEDIILNNILIKKDSIIYVESSYFKTTKIKGEVIELFKNPNIKEFKQIPSWQSVKEVRGLLTLDGKTLYVWDANVGMHIDVIEGAFNKTPSDFVPLSFSENGGIAITPTAFAVPPYIRGTFKDIIINSDIVNSIRKNT